MTPKECLNRFLELIRSSDIAYARLLRKWNISLNATWALEYLHSHPEGVEPAVLAERTRMLRQTVTVVLNDLEDRNWLVRVPHGADRRRKLVSLTPEGERCAAALLEEIEKIEVQSFSKMSEKERETLIRLTESFCDSISAAAGPGQ